MTRIPVCRSLFGSASMLATLLRLVLLLSLRPPAALGLVRGGPAGSTKSRGEAGVCSSPEHPGSPPSTVDVWSNVIDPERLAPLLDEESIRIGLGHQVFSRSPESDAGGGTKHGHSAIEQVLDSILTELDDDAKYVEYWTRREWRAIHAHADVDEYRAKQEQTPGAPVPSGGFRYPRNGHVLYLSVGSRVRGPTCVFPNRRSGGDLLRKNRDIRATGNDDSNDDDDDGVEVVTVPAVPGRLLRFRGDSLHAVPRPTDFWLLRFVQGSPEFAPEEEWGRSVVLFNTWSDEPPAGLPVDGGDGNGDGNGIGDGNGNGAGCNPRADWERAFPLAPEARGDEDETELVTERETEHGDERDLRQGTPLPTKIWLLGDQRRRDHAMQTVKLESTEALRKALYQESEVTSTILGIPS